jgi:oxygen-independent coproporphyrinogen-3 oxidase
MAVALEAGDLRRNFQGYTTDAAGTLLGLGASAIGHLPQGFAQNITAEVAWRAAVAAGRLPVARGVALTDEDRFRGEIIERLMCDLSVDLEAVCARHGRAVSDLSDSVTRLAPFVGDGLVRFDGRILRIEGYGRLVVRSVCAAFDTYFDPGVVRHSKAL